MGMFVAYLPLTDEEIDKSAEENIPLLERWFEDHPDRDDCDAEFWYGRRITFLRGDNIREKVLEAAAFAKANHPGGKKDPDEEA